MITTYILKCESGEYYCGKTNNIKRRMFQHQNEKYPHFFCNDKRRRFELIFWCNGDYEAKIKKFIIKHFVEMLKTMRSYPS